MMPTAGGVRESPGPGAVGVVAGCYSTTRKARRRTRLKTSPAFSRAWLPTMMLSKIESGRHSRERWNVRAPLPPGSVVAFRRLGWSARDYERWSAGLLAEGHALVTPTRHLGETITRFAFVNPRTTIEDVRAILDTMA